MKEQPQWNTIGKRMPYRLPQGFFEQEAAKLQQLAATERQNGSSRRTIRLGWWIASAAAVVVILLVTLLRVESTSRAEHTSPLYAYYEAMSSDELDGWVEFYEADLFLAE